MTSTNSQKNIYVAIQIVMISVILGTVVQMVTELTSDSVNVDQIALYIFLIIGMLFVAAVFNGKANRIAEGLGGEKI